MFQKIINFSIFFFFIFQIIFSQNQPSLLQFKKTKVSKEKQEKILQKIKKEFSSKKSIKEKKNYTISILPKYIKKGYNEVIDFLISNSSLSIKEISKRFQKRGGNILIPLIAHGNKKSLNKLLKEGMEINRRGNYIFYDREFFFSKTKTIRKVLQHPLIAAAAIGNLELVKFFVKKGYRVNMHYYNTPLVAASGGGYLEIVKFLVSKGAKVNKPAFDSGTFMPVIEASLYGRLEVVKFLLKNGANFKLVDKINKSILQYAIYGRHLELIKYLLEEETNIKKTDDRDIQNCLISAAAVGNLKVIKLLEKKGAKINKSKYFEGRIFKAAVEGGNFKVIDYLLKKGVRY